MRLQLRRHSLHLRGEFSSAVPSLRGVSLRGNRYSFTVNRDSFSTVPSQHHLIIPSVAMAMIPPSEGGSGYIPPFISLFSTPASFMFWLSRYDVPFQEHMFAVRVLMRNLDPNCGSKSQDDDIGRVSLPSELRGFKHEELFSSRVESMIEKIKNVDLGRLNAERVPSRLLRSGLMMENHVGPNKYWSDWHYLYGPC